MEIILGIIVLCLIVSLFSAIWPLFLIAALVYIAWKAYEIYYYKSSSFSEIKQKITNYIDDCNDLNQHIEDLKHTSLISNKTVEWYHLSRVVKLTKSMII